MKSNAFTKTLIAVAVAGAIGAGFSVSGIPVLQPAKASSAPSAASSSAVPQTARGAHLVSDDQLTIGPRIAPDFAAIVEKNGPAVVHIRVSGAVKPAVDREKGPQGEPGDPMWEFFRRFGPGPQRGPGAQIPARGQGSGFIVSADGMILTNAHVVADAQQVRVKLTDRREFDAKVIGVDRSTDVALIRIEATNLPTVRLGDPTKLRVGDPVLAIGAPFGFENTATSGIVSAKSRSLPDETYVPFIQTDVAVNPGNSGGPLFNERGEVVGINSQIYTRSGGYQGLSFAIPIDLATRIQHELAQHGKVTRARLGVTIQELDQALANAFKLPRPHGALVSSVEPGGPAQKAGLRSGDVILGLDGQPIEHSADLPARITAMRPGSDARLQVLRDGKRIELRATLGRLPAPVAEADDAATPSQGRLGLAVRPLQPAEKQQAGVGGGLLVEQVSGPAARAGVQPGDVILSLNGKPVGDIEQLQAQLAKSSRNVALLVQRDGARLFLPLELS